MRETRSSSRVPLQTIAAQNGQKMAKDARNRLPGPVKQQRRSRGKAETDIPEQTVGSFTDIKVKSQDDATRPEPHSMDPVSPLGPRRGQRRVKNSDDAEVIHGSATTLAPERDMSGGSEWTISGKRRFSPSVERPPAKLLKAEAESEEEESSESEEELDYEQLRERNMRDNQAFFSSLGIEQAKERIRISRQKIPKPSVKREPKKQEMLPRRKSLRIQRIDPSGQPLPPEPEPEPLEVEHPRIATGPVRMIEAIESEEGDHSVLTGAWPTPTAEPCQPQPQTTDLSRFVSVMKKMTITTKAKVCKDRLFSVTLHPSPHTVLAMAGDKWGRLGFWDIRAADQQRSVVTYRPHSRPIGHIVVPPHSPVSVYTCSYDATLRRGDIEKGVFDEMYSVPEEEDELFRSFDFLSPSSMVLAQFRGDVVVLDTRTPGQKAEQQYRVCDKYLRTVSVHPTDPNFFITAGTDMKVSVWDLRKLRAKGSKPLHALTHGRAVSSAYFSPLTGKHILSCSADDTLNVFNCSPSCGEVTRAKTVSHNNRTGRWLTPFRSVWHPSREDVFFVGSMKQPRRMEAFGVDGRLLHEFQGDWLSSVCSVVHFHPSLNILLGGNSSGYVFPFM